MDAPNAKGRSHGRRFPAVALGIAAVLALAPAALPAAAHEIPTDVTVLAFVRPEGDRLQLLVRVPLEAMRDYDFPLRGPGYLEVAVSDRMIRDAAVQWIAHAVRLYENGVALGDEEVVAARISLPSDRSFESFERALAHVRGPPLSEGIDLHWQQALLDVLFEVPIASETSRFAIDPDLAHLGIDTTTVLRFLPAGGSERVLQYGGDPGIVRLDPRWHQAALRFVELGFFHILEGFDHLLFLLCLVVPLRRFRPLVPVVTAFTVAHSITLIASAFGLAPTALWFPPLIETLIAASIVYMALENMLGGVGLQRRWLITFGFGLVHGFGFSFLLRDTLQFAGSHLLTSLLAFNVGVEIGQLVVLAVSVPVLQALFRRLPSQRAGTVVLSALLAHSGWHWMTERGARLAEYDYRWPVLDLTLLAAAMRWTMLLLILAGAVWLLFLLFGQAGPRREGEAVAAGAGGAGGPAAEE